MSCIKLTFLYVLVPYIYGFLLTSMFFFLMPLLNAVIKKVGEGLIVSCIHATSGPRPSRNRDTDAIVVWFPLWCITCLISVRDCNRAGKDYPIIWSVDQSLNAKRYPVQASVNWVYLGDARLCLFFWHLIGQMIKWFIGKNDQESNY